jgi:hypothetical protein
MKHLLRRLLLPIEGLLHGLASDDELLAFLWKEKYFKLVNFFGRKQEELK